MAVMLSIMTSFVAFLFTNIPLWRDPKSYLKDYLSRVCLDRYDVDNAN